MYSDCLCPLCVLDNGYLSECYTRATEQNYKRKFAMVSKLARNPRFTQSPKQEYEETNVLKKNLKEIKTLYQSEI